MKALDEADFTIVGTGLMGSSLALSLRDVVRSLHGVDTNPEARTAAAPYFDTMNADLECVVTADVIVLATPVRAILELLDQLKTLAKPGALLLDLGSAKAPIIAAMDSLPPHLAAIGGHPMCGRELSGPAAADGGIYRGCVFVLCESHRTTPETLAFARQMVTAIGAQPVMLDPSAHDRAVAAVSHLPYLLSAILVATVQEVAADDDTPWRLASSGFRDTSRLAASDVTMMGDTLLANRQAVLAVLGSFRERLEVFYKLLLEADDDQLRAALEAVRQARLGWSQPESKR